MSSSGEMKMSLKLMTCARQICFPVARRHAHVFVLEVLEELQLAVCALGQDWGTERLHNLLYGHGLVRELISSGTAEPSVQSLQAQGKHTPDETECAHAYGLQIGVPLPSSVAGAG
jgi:hypothetical protein